MPAMTSSDDVWRCVQQISINTSFGDNFVSRNQIRNVKKGYNSSMSTVMATVIIVAMGYSYKAMQKKSANTCIH